MIPTSENACIPLICSDPAQTSPAKRSEMLQRLAGINVTGRGDAGLTLHVAKEPRSLRVRTMLSTPSRVTTQVRLWIRRSNIRSSGEE